VAGAQIDPAVEMGVPTASEAFPTDCHCRYHVTHAEMAFDGEGKITTQPRPVRVRKPRQSRRLHSTFSRRRWQTYLSTARCCRASTQIPAIYARSTAVLQTPTPCLSIPSAAPAGRRHFWSAC